MISEDLIQKRADAFGAALDHMSKALEKAIEKNDFNAVSEIGLALGKVCNESYQIEVMSSLSDEAKKTAAELRSQHRNFNLGGLE